MWRWTVYLIFRKGFIANRATLAGTERLRYEPEVTQSQDITGSLHGGKRAHTSSEVYGSSSNCRHRPEETFYCTCVYSAFSPLHYLVTRVGQVKAHQLPQSVIIRYAGDGHYAYPFFYNARIGCA